MGLLRRRAITALCVSNAVKPGLGYSGPQGSVYGWSTSKILGFTLGWPAGELAPHLLALTALDTAQATLRGKLTRSSLALSAATMVSLGWAIKKSATTRRLGEAALNESLGPDALQGAPTRSARRRSVASVSLLNPVPRTPSGVEAIRNVPYRAGGRDARLDIYRPKDPGLRGAPVLIEVHGGAWTIGDKATEGRVLMGRMAARGWVCVAINYRLAPKHPFPAQIIDVKRAIAWVKDNIAAFGGDPSYVVLTGGSAGGHLTALAALTPGLDVYQPGFEGADTSVAACVPFYGVYDLAGLNGDQPSIDHRDKFLGPHVFMRDPATHRAEFEQASPITHAGANRPDFFVLHGSSDVVVPVSQAREFVRRLRQSPTRVVTYLELPSAQHGFDTFSSIRARQAIDTVELWLEWHRTHRRPDGSAASATNETPVGEVA